MDSDYELGMMTDVDSLLDDYAVDFDDDTLTLPEDDLFDE